MSEFNTAVELAKKQQHRKIIFSLFGFVAVLVLIAIIILASRGTHVEVLPAEISAEAQVSTSKGLAVVINGYLYSLSSVAEIEVQAPNYITARKTLTQENFGTVTTVTLKPKPGELSLSSSVNDDKTSWRINGELIAVSQHLQQTLEVGDYSVTVNHPYFEPQTINYTITPALVINQAVTLKPIDVGVNIKSKPSDAQVLIDGVEQGKTPFVTSLNGGLHQVDIVKAGYDTTHEQLEVKNTSKDIQRNYRLLHKSAGVTASTTPEGGTLTLNGVRVNSHNKIRIKPGRKSTLTYSKLGYFSQSKTVTLKADQVKPLSFSLQESKGQIEIVSTPVAQVTIDGKPVGNTPLTLSLNTLAHRVELSLPNYRSQSRAITPTANSAEKIVFKLIREDQARLMEAASSYKNYAGGEMVLFEPNDRIVMGAERSEKGQRANEFIRTVSMTKPFYAGRHEVTNGAYASFNPNHSGPANQPVVSITWLEAARYANWLSQAESLKPVYQINNSRLTRINTGADGYRLLTEAEWEWLARKARRRQQTQFVWGDSTVIPKNAVNIADMSVKGTLHVYVPNYNDGYAGIAPVMNMRAEQSGLYDMGGNVSEWVHDAYTLMPPKKGAVYNDELSPTLSAQHVVKGANFRQGSFTELRAAYRDGQAGSRNDLGFRLGRFVNGGH